MLPEMLQLSIVVAYMTPRQPVRTQHSPVVVMVMVQQDGGTEQSRVRSALFTFALKEDSEEQSWSRGAASVSVLMFTACWCLM